MDFAGGTAVHVCSGSSVAALSIFFQLEACGWKSQISHWSRTLKIEFKDWRFWTWLSIQRNSVEPDLELTTDSQNTDHLEQPGSAQRHAVGTNSEGPSLPHSITNMVIGTAMLWVGWFGFNGGSALGANLRAVSACLATQAAASSGGTIGLLIQWGLGRWDQFLSGKPHFDLHTPSAQEFCDGVIAGLVAITPAAGYVRSPRRNLVAQLPSPFADCLQVPVKYAPVFGVVAALVCKILRDWMYNSLLPMDHLAIFAVHAGGGATGMLLTAFFAK